MARRRRLIKNDEDHDPMAVLTNLFDVAMVFAVALMVALVTRFDMTEMFSQEDFTVVKNPGTEQMEIITKKGENRKVHSVGRPERQELARQTRGHRLPARKRGNHLRPRIGKCAMERGRGRECFPAPASLRTPPHIARPMLPK